jgi:hypothetical protein
MVSITSRERLCESVLRLPSSTVCSSMTTIFWCMTLTGTTLGTTARSCLTSSACFFGPAS